MGKCALLYKKLLHLVVTRGVLLPRGGGLRSSTKSGKWPNSLSTIPTHVLWILTNTVLGPHGTEAHSQQQNFMRKSCHEWCRNTSQAHGRQGLLYDGYNECGLKIPLISRMWYFPGTGSFKAASDFKQMNEISVGCPAPLGLSWAVCQGLGRCPIRPHMLSAHQQ